MEQLFVSLLNQQGAAVGISLFFCFGMAFAIFWMVKSFNEEREKHREDREEHWKAYNHLLEKNIESINRLSTLIDSIIRSKI
jgi:large-conductance mechanosensitive channel